MHDDVAADFPSSSGAATPRPAPQPGAGSADTRPDDAPDGAAHGGHFLPGQRRTVLIVDDVEDTRELLRWQLSTEPDLDVVGEAADGPEAVEKATLLQPDVVILDIYLPTLSGLAALPALQRVVPRAGVVMITSFDSPGARTACEELGVRSFVVKGTRRADLVRQVRAAAGLA